MTKILNYAMINCKKMHGGNIIAQAKKYNIAVDRIIDFSANINPLGFPNNLKELIIKNIKSITNYPDIESSELKKSLSDYIHVEPKNIIVGNGSCELIYLLSRLFSHQNVLIPSPTFTEYERAFKNRVRLIKLKENFSLSIDKVVDNLGDDQVVFLCNPNNPTGGLWQKEEILRLAKQVMVIVDEAFMDFVGNKESVARESATIDNLFVIRSLTKFFAIPGLRVGYGIGTQKTISNLEALQPPWNVNSIAQIVATHVVKDKDFINKTIRLVKKERDFLFNSLSQINYLTPYSSFANFILVKLNRLNSTILTNNLGKRGILIRDCSDFAFLNNSFIRVAIRSRVENSKLISELKNI
ncbi:MAG: threonine-phosphate decarboxylase CobD [bacterium]